MRSVIATVSLFRKLEEEAFRVVFELNQIEMSYIIFGEVVNQDMTRPFV